MKPDALDILASVTTQLLQGPTLQAGLQALTDAALRITPADHASVRLCGGPVMDVGARSGTGAGARPFPFRRGQGVVGWVAEHGKPVRLADGRRDPRFDRRARLDFDVASIMAIPITIDGRTLGVLSMSARERDAFGAEHETVAQLLANSAAHALRAAELERQAITDCQTLAYNRRHLLPRLQEEMERARRDHKPLGLLLMDLDHFKRINDRHGHAAGDDVLRLFVARVRALVRRVDVLVRRGGEEFVLILPSTGARAAARVAERIRSDLAGRRLRLTSGSRVRQTVSIGVAIWDGRERPEALDERADRAMYDAKQAGRDRVALAPPPADPRTTHTRRRPAAPALPANRPGIARRT